jgi:hypothetical protein
MPIMNRYARNFISTELVTGPENMSKILLKEKYFFDSESIESRATCMQGCVMWSFFNRLSVFDDERRTGRGDGGSSFGTGYGSFWLAS